MIPIAVQTKKLSKSFDAYNTAVHQLNLEVQQGEILALLGPSGCGKTTILRLIAGFERPENGSIWLNNQKITGDGVFVPPERRGVGMVFQDYAIFPHLSVFKNVSFGLRKKKKTEIEEIVAEMLNLVGLAAYARRFPHELSGGQRQRVALARALAPRPVLLLLDEPFSNLDADLRTQMRTELRTILKKIQATVILVTHDQEEAMFMGDRIAVINRGQLEQINTPETVFHQPVTRFVAEFMGETNFLPGVVCDQGIETEIGLYAQKSNLPIGTQVEITLRPDDVQFEPQADAQCSVAARNFRGATNFYTLALPSGHRLSVMEKHTSTVETGTPVMVQIDPGHDLAIFPFDK
jgi:iron(III) transport system ATP-binding protein